MTIDSASKLVDALREAQVLDSRQLAEIARTPDAHGSDPRLLAECLVQLGWITRYQGEQALKGAAALLTLGPYRILDLLGEDRLGPTFKARVEGGELAAIRILPAALLSSPEVRAGLAEDVREASQLLEHRNLARMLRLDEHLGLTICAQEWVEGTDLASLVRGSGPCPVPAACDAIRQAAQGLQACHDRGLTHGSLTPASIRMVESANGDGGVKVLWIGLGRLRPGGPSSPEADRRGDVLALGRILYYLLSGQAPRAVGEQAGREARAALPMGLAEVIARAVPARPEEGFASAGELAEALEPFCQKARNLQEPPPAEELPLPPPADVEAPASPAESQTPQEGPPAEEELAAVAAEPVGEAEAAAAELPPAESKPVDAQPAAEPEPVVDHPPASSEPTEPEPRRHEPFGFAPSEQVEHREPEHAPFSPLAAREPAAGPAVIEEQSKGWKVGCAIGLLLHLTAFGFLIWWLVARSSESEPGTGSKPPTQNRK